MKRSVLALAVIALVVFPVRVEATDPSFLPVTNASGLSHNSVYSMIQDRLGFIWIGTADGLNRFDGHEFVVYRNDPMREGSLTNPVVRALKEDRDGVIWVGTEGGIHRFDPVTGRFDPYRLDAYGGGEAGNVFEIFLSSRGEIWAGTDHGPFRYRREVDRFEPVALHENEDDLEIDDVVSLAEHPDGSIWALIQEDQRLMLRTVAPELDRRFEISPAWGTGSGFTIDRKGQAWLKPPHPVALDGQSGVLEPSGHVNRTPQVQRVIEATDGAIWFALEDGFCRAGTSGDVSCGQVTPGGNWLENIASTLIEDRSGAIWIGTFAGLRRFDPMAKPFEVWRHDRADDGSLGASAVSSIWEDADGVVWVGTFGGGLSRIDRRAGTVRRFRHSSADPSSIPHDVIWTIHGGADGALWLGTEGGLARFDRLTNRSRTIGLPFPPEAERFRRIGVIEGDERGRLWIGGPLGLYVFDIRTGSARFFHPPRETSHRQTSIESILAASDGRIWVGTGASGLREFDESDERFTSYPLVTSDDRRLTSEGLWCLEEDDEGAIWVGSGVGLSRFDPAARTFLHYLQRDGLPGSIVYSITRDDERRLWMGTNRGLVRFSPDAPRGGQFRTFDVSDGIAGMEFNRNAVFRGSRGELFFGGLDGLTIFDPGEILDDERRAPVVLTSIEVIGSDGVRTLESRGLERLTLLPGDDSFGFGFVALSFSNPERSRYRYRLDGFDREWVDSGSMRFARYTNVPHGDYVFRVIASNQDGVWNEEGASLSVTILPPFWMTWWFRVVVALALVSLLWLGHRARVNRLVELERLRLRIANDLHDDLSSDLSGIAVSAELLRTKTELDAEDRKQLRTVRDKAVEMAGAMRDTAWGINPEHDTLGAIVRRMRASTESILGDTEHRFEAVGIAEDEAIEMEVRRCLLTIFKELVHNIASHANASDVEITLRGEGANLVLTVADDGDGFDPAGDHDGDGLRSMHRRANGLGGSLWIESHPGEGTRAELRVPRRPLRWRGFGMAKLFGR